jgi:hypothetical protein
MFTIIEFHLKDYCTVKTYSELTNDVNVLQKKALADINVVYKIWKNASTIQVTL